MRKDTLLLTLVLAFAPTFSISCSVTRNPEVGTSVVTIISPPDANAVERLAAKEIRRYLYLRTGKLLQIVNNNKLPRETNLIVVGQKNRPAIKTLAEKTTNLSSSVDSLEAQQYMLKTITFGKQQAVLITGGDSIGTLYAAYHFAEHLGVRFYLHGDTIPDERIELKIPDLDENGKPLFNLRGIQPFHDFPEGPDWWNIDDYKAIIAQLPKLRMNFIGFHTYPQGNVGPEPTVWIGMPEDSNEDGSVKFSYPARHFTTANVTGAWGYEPTRTGDYSFGAAQMFEHDDYGAGYMRGMNPWTQLSAEKANELFNRMGIILKEAFSYARALGIKTCAGTETPLTIPDSLKEHIKASGIDLSDPASVQKVYEGMFERINNAYPLDYYWFWTPEKWTWGNPTDEQVDATLTDFRAAIAAAEKVKTPFILATCGWVLGPPKDRALFNNFLPREMPLSCINRNVGFTPVEEGFARIKGRPKWAIPWLEDDGAMIIPQLWAGRMRRDAADALAYGCTGLMGIHWRTRILGPNVSALAHAGWEQREWNPEFELSESKLSEGRQGGRAANFPNNPITDFDNKLRDLPVSDFYRDWAFSEFGAKATEPIARLFESLDGGAMATEQGQRTANLPRPSTWVKGPGAIKPDERPWEQVSREYAFVEKMAELRQQVNGPGNLERFDYWLNNFRYLRAVGQVSCTWAKLNKAMNKLKAEKNPEARIQLAQEVALPIRKELVTLLADVHRYLLATVTTNGAMGNVTNWQQHVMPILLTESGKELGEMLGRDLPADAVPSERYNGRLRLIVPTARNNLSIGEDLTLKIIILAGDKPKDAALYWRSIGKGEYKRLPITHIRRGVYSAKIPAGHIKTDDIEYYIKASLADGQTAVFPATAPNIAQTVVVSGGRSPN